LLLTLVISLSGLNERYLEQLMPDAQAIIHQSGMSFWLSTGGILLQTGISLIFHIVLEAILSTLGAVIYAAIKKE
jgi:hypothetical protein